MLFSYHMIKWHYNFIFCMCTWSICTSLCWCVDVHVQRSEEDTRHPALWLSYSLEYLLLLSLELGWQLASPTSLLSLSSVALSQESSHQAFYVGTQVLMPVRQSFLLDELFLLASLLFFVVVVCYWVYLKLILCLFLFCIYRLHTHIGKLPSSRRQSQLFTLQDYFWMFLTLKKISRNHYFPIVEY